MNAEQLLQHFERVSEAPDAIPRLRRFILDLAVRGKLVEQDPSDEPAAELLKRIVAETPQNKAIKERSEPWPYALPEHWSWTQFGRLIAKSDAGWSPRTENHPRIGENWGVLKVSAVSWDYFRSWENKQVLPGTEPRVQAVVNQGDFLISRANTAELIGRAVIVQEVPTKLMMSDKVVRLHLNNKCNSKYLWLVNNYSDVSRRHYVRRASGVSPSMKNISRHVILNLPVPLPPLAEQHRIVAKVDELMNLCDQLEAAKAEREQFRDSLVAASLQGLSQPAEEEETFREHARFTLNILPLITKRTTHIKQLRQSILDLAVRGKLVPQDHSDEPAAELLKRIAERKVQMMDRGANGGRRKKYRDIAITDSEKYLALPGSWSWARLVELGLTQTGSSPSSANPDLFGDEIPFIKPGDLDGKEIFYDGPGLSLGGVRHSRLASSNTVLMVCIGATLGKVNTTTRPICFNQQINSLTPVKGVESSFVALALKSSEFQKLAWSKAGTGTLPIISKGKWEDLPIPLPPLAEQHRIVAKVDQLMAICDQLEAQITENDQDSRRFLEAVLQEALAPVVADAA